MVRPTSWVWSHFIKEKDCGKNIAICKYCQLKYLSPNATKMTRHIKKCIKCPFEILPSFPNIDDDDTELPVAVYNLAVASHGESMMQSTSASGCNEIAHVDSLPSSSTPMDESSSPKRAKKDNQSVLSTFVDTMTNSEIEKANLAFAKAVYSSNCPLSFSDNIYWKQFLHQLRPSYEVPSCHDLTHRLLNKAYNNVKGISMDKINKAEFLTVLTDGWSSVSNGSIINFIVATPSPVFYKSIEANHNNHTGQYMSEELTKVMNEIGGHKVIALVTDNASNMKATWRILQIKYPNLNTIGCSAHGLNLLLRDIEEIETFQLLISRSKEVIKSFKDEPALLSVFTEKQKQKKVNAAPTLTLPGQTKRGSTYIMFKSLLDGKESLQETVLQEDVDQDLKQIVLDDDIFWASIEGLINVLKPIYDSITMIESDSAVLSDVPHAFHYIKNSSSSLKSTPLQTDEEERIISAIEKRQEMCCQPIHLAAYMLDPRYEQNNLNSEEYEIAIDFIGNFPTTAGVLANFAQFQAREGIYSNDAIWSAAEFISPLVWWKGLLCNQTLSNVATKLFSIPPSAAACQRLFSEFSKTHATLRSKLSNDKASKLMAIRSNLILQKNVIEEKQVSDSDE